MRVVSLNIGRPMVRVVGERRYSTAINRRAVDGAVELGETGFVGDRVADAVNHGGPDKAVCCYPHEHYAYWGERMGADPAVPSFGENLTTSGLLEDEVCIGDVYSIGRATVQVSQPRQPCSKLADNLGGPQFVGWVNETGYTGFYVRVLQAGSIEVGDTIERIARPHPELAVVKVIRALVGEPVSAELLARLTVVSALSTAWRDRLGKRLASIQRPDEGF